MRPPVRAILRQIRCIKTVIKTTESAFQESRNINERTHTNSRRIFSGQ